MGTNRSTLSVDVADRISIAEIEAALIASYEARGARLAGRGHDEQLERETEPPPRAKLGVAVGPAEHGWAVVVDSFGYTSDARLAEDLSEHLGTTVFRRTIAEAADYEALERFGPARDAGEAPDAAMEYRYLDAESAGFRFLVFEGVAANVYAHLPRVRVDDVVCPKCGYDAGWSPGLDVPSAPAPEALLPLRAAADAVGSSRASLLIELRCPMCRASMAWARATREAGLVTEVRKLAEPPARASTTLTGARERPSTFDFALSSQRKSIERLFPSRARKSRKPKAEADLAGAFAEVSRAALEQALAKVIPTLRKTEPPLLSWVFAPDRDALVAALEGGFRDFTWQPTDLPGKVALQIRAWLGPKPGAPALEGFVARVGALLGPDAFARQARHPETFVWLVAVGLQLPDQTWAALALFDQHRP